MPSRMTKRNSLALLLAALVVASPATAQQSYVAGMPYMIAETGQSFNRLQDAIFAIGTGTGTLTCKYNYYLLKILLVKT